MTIKNTKRALHILMWLLTIIFICIIIMLIKIGKRDMLWVMIPIGIAAVIRIKQAKDWIKSH